MTQILINLAQNAYIDKSRTSSNMGGVGSKSRSVGQIFVKSCYHSRGHNFDPILIKLVQKANIDNTSDKFEYGLLGQKVGQYVKS